MYRKPCYGKMKIFAFVINLLVNVIRGDTSQLALLSATEDDSFHPLAVIETIKRLGDLRTAAFRYQPP